MALKAGWYATLTGDSMDLDTLAHIFVGQDPSFYSDGEQWFVGSASFDALNSHGEVREAATELLSNVNGAMRLEFGDHQPVTIAHVVRVLPDGRREIHAFFEPVRFGIRTRATGVLQDAEGNIVPLPTGPVVKWVKLAETDQTARELLWLLSLESHDWFSLYKVHELIKQSGGFDFAVRAGLTTDAELDRLTGTANNFTAAGRAARHANIGGKPMRAQPMTLAEGTAILSRVVERWLNDRA